MGESMKIKIEYRAWTESDSNAKTVRAIIQIGNKFGKTIPAVDLGQDIMSDVYFYAESGECCSRKMRVTYNGNKYVVWETAGNLLGLCVSKSPIRVFVEGVVSSESQLVKVLDVPEKLVMYKAKEGFWSSTYRQNAEKREIKLK
jgi:hypothetical protein